MFCKNCNSPLKDGAKFCTVCGTPVVNNDNPNNFQQSGYQNHMANDVNQSYSDYNNYSAPINAGRPHNREIPAENGMGVASVFNIILGVIVVVLIAVVTFLFIHFSKNEPKKASSDINLQLKVDDVTSVTKSSNYTFSGQISTTGEYAELSINGNIIDSVSDDEGIKSWSHYTELGKGTNSFKIVLYDSDGNSKEQTVEIVRDVQLVYPEGTVLVKYNSSGVFIRPTPSTSETPIDKIESYDYTSKFICVGEEHKDYEGYVWCKVKTPKGQIGWVRSDLMCKNW